MTNIRGFKKVYMVTVLEGKGVESDPYREVKYFYDDDRDQFIGAVDNHCIHEFICVTNGQSCKKCGYIQLIK